MLYITYRASCSSVFINNNKNEFFEKKNLEKNPLRKKISDFEYVLLNVNDTVS